MTFMQFWMVCFMIMLKCNTGITFWSHICNTSILFNATAVSSITSLRLTPAVPNCWISSVPISSLSFSLRCQSSSNKPIPEQHWPHSHLTGSDSPSISSELTFTPRPLLQALPLPTRSLRWGRAAALPALRAKRPQRCWRSWGCVD